MRITNIVAAAVAALALAAPALAQDQPAPFGPQERAARQPPIPLEVKVVIAKYQGEKRTSSLPYNLAVNAGMSSPSAGITQLTIGSDVAVPATTFAPATDGKTPTPITSFNYRNVGTVISASAVGVAGPDERFELDLSIDETAVGTTVSPSAIGGGGGPVNQLPVFKSFKTRNKLLLRNGQTREFVAATDRVSGETVKIEVTLTVVK